MNIPLANRLVTPPVEALPYPRLQGVVVRAVEAALVEAWCRILRHADRVALDNVGEDSITNPLVDELCRMLTDGWGAFRGETYAAVIKSEEIKDRSGRSLQMKPDISVRLLNPPACVLEQRYYAIFIEAKIIQKPGKAVRLYYGKGVKRFIDGAYAWKMQQAILCAYVLDGSRLVPDLSDALAARGTALSVATDDTLRFGDGVNRAEIAHTLHPRRWTYTAPNSGTPGPITLSHVWLRPD